MEEVGGGRREGVEGEGEGVGEEPPTLLLDFALLW